MDEGGSTGPSVGCAAGWSGRVGSLRRGLCHLHEDICKDLQGTWQEWMMVRVKGGEKN